MLPDQQNMGEREDMKRVVIVEDEKLVQLGIESLFEARDDYAIVGSYTRAKPALDSIEKSDPDIIITDIKMPGMDGLAFIGKLQELRVRAKIVVLSCLEDFDIVTKAFKLGAVDYILKHQLDETELFTTLDLITVQERATDRDDDRDMWSSLKRFSDRVGAEDLSVGFKDPVVYLMIFKKRYTKEHLPIDTEVDIVWALRFVGGMLQEFEIGDVYREDASSLVLVIEGDEAHQERRNSFFSRLIRQLEQYINSPVVILRSPDIDSIVLTDQWEQLLKAKDTAFYIGKTKVVMVRQAQRLQRVESAALPEPELLLREEQISHWESAVTSYFEQASRSEMDPSQLCMDLIVHWHHVKELLRALHIESRQQGAEEPRLTLFEYLKEFDDFTQLKQWYMQELPLRVAPIHTLQGHSRKIMKIKLHLLEHYAEHITLQELAQIMSMNSNYLCELFKRETGVGFVDYLNSIRVEKAKVLLLNSDATVEDVAVQVGCTSPSHFSRLFKKVTGKTVTDFRTTRCGETNIEENT